MPCGAGVAVPLPRGRGQGQRRAVARRVWPRPDKQGGCGASDDDSTSDGGMNYDLYHGDCLEVMARLPDGSIDAVICDPPYGTMQGFNGIDWDVALAPA